MKLNLKRMTLSLMLICLTLSGCGGGSNDSPAVPQNQPPAVNAGNDFSIDEKSQVELNGTATDSDGNVVSIRWSQTSGPLVDLESANNNIALFIAPSTNDTIALSFTFTATDDSGLNASDEVTVTIEPVNEPPIIQILAPKIASTSEIVLLDASNSTGDSQIASFLWQRTDANPIEISVDGLSGPVLTITIPELDYTSLLSFSLTVTDSDNLVSEKIINLGVVPKIESVMNDTGKDLCDGFNYVASSEYNLSCNLDTTPSGDIIPRSQDGHVGRDATAPSNQDGKAGFNFIKLDSDGAALDKSSTDHRCVLDNVTKLTWEIKSATNPARFKEYTYSWYQRDIENNGGVRGTINGGNCQETSCDTEAYIEYLNTTEHCGFNDWRLPEVMELESLKDYGQLPPDSVGRIDNEYFNDIVEPEFWTNSPWQFIPSSAWYVDFNGGSGVNQKTEAKAVRAVRGGQQ